MNEKQMKGKISVTIDDDFETMRARVRVKRLRTIRIWKPIMLVCDILIFLITIALICYEFYMYGKTSMLAIIYLIIACMFFWLYIKGIEDASVKKIKKNGRKRVSI